MDFAKLKPADKITIVAVAVLTLCAIVGVAIGWATHTEPGFDDRMPRWTSADMPLALCVESYGAEQPSHAALESALYVVGLINDRLDFDAYVVSATDCDVVLTYGEPSERGGDGSRITDPGGYAERRGARCHAATVNVHGEIETLVVHHELGHCLGLAHDDYEQSIMRPVQTETPNREFPPWISDHDRSLLRETYGP